MALLSWISQQIVDSNDGKLLGLIEFLSQWDPISREHVPMVEKSQKKGEGLQVNCNSNESKSEFIADCSDVVKQHVL